MFCDWTKNGDTETGFIAVWQRSQHGKAYWNMWDKMQDNFIYYISALFGMAKSNTHDAPLAPIVPSRYLFSIFRYRSKKNLPCNHY